MKMHTPPRQIEQLGGSLLLVEVHMIGEFCVHVGVRDYNRKSRYGTSQWYPLPWQAWCKFLGIIIA